MIFIITLTALIVERFFHWSHLRHWHWYLNYERLFGQRLNRFSPLIALSIIILPVLIAVGCVSVILSLWVFGLFYFIFSIITLLYCLGSDNLWVDTYKGIQELHKGNTLDALSHIQPLAHSYKTPTLEGIHTAFVEAIMIAAHQRIISVVFWFVVLGPFGAILYRLLDLCRERSVLGVNIVAGRIVNILDWLPARIFTGLLALAGHFNDVFSLWKQEAKKGIHSNEHLIAVCSLAALGKTEPPISSGDCSLEKEALALLDRVLIIGLVILALIVLIT